MLSLSGILTQHTECALLELNNYSYINVIYFMVSEYIYYFELTDLRTYRHLC